MKVATPGLTGLSVAEYASMREEGLTELEAGTVVAAPFASPLHGVLCANLIHFVSRPAG